MLLKITLVLFSLLFLFPNLVFARTTPEDILNAQRADFNQTASKYSLTSKNKLSMMEKKLAEVNQKLSTQLSVIMSRQGDILEEYRRRQDYQTSAQLTNVEYWVTYAHEAVAYQAGKIYIFNLTTEKNLVSDINSSINLLQNELNTTRGKVIKSQKLLMELVK